MEIGSRHPPHKVGTPVKEIMDAQLCCVQYGPTDKLFDTFKIMYNQWQI